MSSVNVIFVFNKVKKSYCIFNPYTAILQNTMIVIWSETMILIDLMIMRSRKDRKSHGIEIALIGCRTIYQYIKLSLLSKSFKIRNKTLFNLVKKVFSIVLKTENM